MRSPVRPEIPSNAMSGTGDYRNLSMLCAFALYLIAHFLLYVFIFRKLSVFRTEKGIFLYHFVAALAFALALLGWAIAGQAQPGWPEIVLMAAGQGIYSLSFLELWSLAQGGYS